MSESAHLTMVKQSRRLAHTAIDSLTEAVQLKREIMAPPYNPQRFKMAIGAARSYLQSALDALAEIDA